MDPGDQPLVFSIINQVEEILITQVSPLLQVSHARDGKYRYSGRTISFPQNITTIANYLSCHLEYFDTLVVRRHGIKIKSYYCHVTKSHVMNALLYKIHNDRLQICLVLPHLNYFTS